MLPHNAIFRFEGGLTEKRLRMEADGVTVSARVAAPLAEQVGIAAKTCYIYAFSPDWHVNIAHIKILNGTSDDRSSGTFSAPIWGTIAWIQILGIRPQGITQFSSSELKLLGVIEELCIGCPQGT